MLDTPIAGGPVMSKVSFAAALAAASICVVGLQSCSSSTKVSSTTSGTVPAFDRSHFNDPKANAYFPLVPGTVTKLRGSDDGEHYLETVTITRATRTIQGVRTTAISDVNRRTNGVLAEKTTDWYATANDGTVWYFGEDTATYDEHGTLDSREGTWLAGRDGASPGVIMPAQPDLGQAYRQEYLRGNAEDQAWIVANDETITVPAGSYRRVVRSYEWSRLEPGVVSVKFYAPGIGIVAERDVAGGTEKFDLVSVKP
jgi:hypothetical protein